MSSIGTAKIDAYLKELGISDYNKVYNNLTAEELVEETIKRGMGVLSDTGAICVKTGKFTGRSPLDRFVVEDEISKDTVAWNDINMPISEKHFDELYDIVTDYFSGKDLFVRDASACADPQYNLNLRLVSEYPWSNQFAFNMFLRPSDEELENFQPDWKILCAPGCKGDPAKHGIRQDNFAIISFKKKTIIIGGTGYTGEIKKGIFSVLNFVLPHDNDVLSMHCSANEGVNGDAAVFFGLSGTGKTTLSADPNRALIGDDEHGWSDNGIFNFEGGCYAKTIDLTKKKEPEIYEAIKHGAILENIHFYPGTRKVDYANASTTQNTRVSYPIYHIENAKIPSRTGHPTNIFFLTADAFGVLPPVSKLTRGQAMYHFISGYTAKVAGTEEGVIEPQTTFSACFGSPFLPLHATKYAEMLGERMEKHKTDIWLINTGWTGGAYGVGSRIKLRYTRAMITAALEGKLHDVSYNTHEIFGLNIPASCPDVPDEILNPKNTWEDKAAYDEKANELAKAFIQNFEQFADKANTEILQAAPRVINNY